MMAFMFFQSLLTIAFVSDIAVAIVCYVRPDYSDYTNNSDCSYQDCHDLNYYANKSLEHCSELHFLSGEFMLSSDLKIKDAWNISLIGSKDVNSVPTTIINCTSAFSMVMHNITGLIVRNIVIKNCGPAKVEKERILLMRAGKNKLRKHAVVVSHCFFVLFEELTIMTNNDNPGLLAVNIMGNCIMISITVNSFILLYNDSQTSKHDNSLEVNNFSFVGDVVIQYKIMLLLFRTSKISITISNGNFRFYRIFKLISIALSRDYHEYKINIKQINFSYNQIDSLISISTIGQSSIKQGTEPMDLEFSDCVFFSNSMVIGKYLINVNKLKSVSWINCLFHKNNNLEMFAASLISTIIIIRNTTFSSNVWDVPLISMSIGILYFYGPVKFTNNTGNSYIFNFTSAIIYFYNYMGILHNNIEGFLHTYHRSGINSVENANLAVKYNYFRYFAKSHLQDKGILYPNCFFQYFGKKNYDEMWYQGKKLNYSINFIDNYMEPLPYSYFGECEWNAYGGSVFKDTIPLEVNRHIIVHKNRWSLKLLDDNQRGLCLCATFRSRSFNCSVYKLGPIYPGELLVVNFAFRYHWNYLVEFHTTLDIIKKSHTTCEFDHDEQITFLKTIFISGGYRYCSVLYLTVLATQKRWCALVLKNDKYLKTGGMFYVMFYSGCPMGFAKYDNKCDCDQVLAVLFNFTCNINDRTILRPGNSWISATTNNYSHNYTVCQVCPFDYCLPQSSHLHLSHPDSQCQFNRSGLLCGQCQQGLSALFGSSQCQRCSNIYILFVLLFAALGILLVFVLFAINITVTDGTVNAFIFYVNIVSINGTIFFPLRQLSYVFICIANLDWGMKTCFYNGMNDHSKMWLQLAFPMYLILIAASLIITSRYSTRLQRLTARRALPVLATLFLLSYTKILQTVCNVLFLYSKVIYLPSNSTKLVWSVDANVPIFEIKFMILFIACLVLFSIMIPFNIILLFTRFLLRFRLVSKFKPLIDAYQGPYKDNCYYWIGLQLVLRATFLGLSSLERTMNLKIGIILISILAAIHGLLRPFKSNFKNYQECLWLINLQVLQVLSFNITNMIYTNILVTAAILHFSTIIIYHIVTYTWIGKVTSNHIMSICSKVYMLLSKMMKSLRSERIPVARHMAEMNNIPNVTYNYHEYREPLIGL